MILFASILIVAAIAVCLLATVGVMLAFHTLRVRAGFAIPARPQLVPTAAEQIPPDLAGFLAQVVPALHEFGFETVASVHAPQMLATVTWTQVLFIRRDRGDRASVMLLRATTIATSALAAAPPELVFATELPDGRSVKTSTHQHQQQQPPPPPPPHLHDRVVTLYAQHRADVEQTLGSGAVGAIPQPGEEVPWLQARAGVIAAALAEHNAFVPAADGASFRPPWALALRAAWQAICARGIRRRALGFDVVVVPAAASRR